MASDHEVWDLYNNITETDDLMAVEGEIVSINKYTNTANVKLPRWGEIPNISIFYHCEGVDHVRFGYRAFYAKQIVVVLIKDGRTLQPPANPGSAQFLTDKMIIVAHGKLDQRPTVKQPLSCKWETFTSPWWWAIGGVYTEDHPASEHGDETICIKHQWNFNGVICPNDDLAGWAKDHVAIYGYSYHTYTYLYAIWDASATWDDDGPITDCPMLNIYSGGYIEFTGSSDFQTYAYFEFTDEHGNIARIFIFKDNLTLNDSERDIPAGLTEYYKSGGDKRIEVHKSEYGLAGDIVRVEMVAACKSGSNTINFWIRWIDFY